MAQTLSQVQCPQCKAPVQAVVQQLIDVSKEPGAKARLLAKSLNMIQCPVCGYEGQLATPLVYHDAEKELLLTYVPPELGLKQNDQERVIGKMINSVIDQLPAEERKAYLLQPTPVLTMQSLVEKILEADGITREQIEAQRERMRLFEKIMGTPEADLMKVVAHHDEEIDATFLQIANLTIQSTRDQRAREFAAQQLERALGYSTLGKEIKAQEESLLAAAESLRAIGSELTHDKLLEIVLEAPDENRVEALVSLARPAFDYTFFQLLSARIDEAADKDKERLTDLRNRILKHTERLDEMQRERLERVGMRLQALIQAEDLETALAEALPYVDELFLSVLQANLAAAKEQGDQATFQRLEEIDHLLSEAIRASLPPGLRFVQELLETPNPDEARAKLEASVEKIDDQFLNGLTSTIQRLEAAGEAEKAKQLGELYGLALRLSMRSKMKASGKAAAEA
ncbi:MAG TPA: hypothetical protein G4O08_11970 [Anaerolineae bacterium]|nr:hypothetical protein [Anaerolineae bacterium]